MLKWLISRCIDNGWINLRTFNIFSVGKEPIFLHAHMALVNPSQTAQTPLKREKSVPQTPYKYIRSRKIFYCLKGKGQYFEKKWYMFHMLAVNSQITFVKVA